MSSSCVVYGTSLLQRSAEARLCVLVSDKGSEINAVKKNDICSVIFVVFFIAECVYTAFQVKVYVTMASRSTHYMIFMQ